MGLQNGYSLLYTFASILYRPISPVCYFTTVRLLYNHPVFSYSPTIIYVNELNDKLLIYNQNITTENEAVNALYVL